MTDGTKMQWFCSPTQIEQANKGRRRLASQTYPLKAEDEKIADEYIDTCFDDKDCDTSAGKSCAKFMWDATSDGSVFASGTACVGDDTISCPSTKSKAIENWNYDTNESFGYYTQYWCQNTDVLPIPNW